MRLFHMAFLAGLALSSRTLFAGIGIVYLDIKSGGSDVATVSPGTTSIPFEVYFSASTSGSTGANNGVQGIVLDIAGSAIAGAGQSPVTLDSTFVESKSNGGLGFNLFAQLGGPDFGRGTGGIGIISSFGEVQSFPGEFDPLDDEPNVGHFGPVLMATGTVNLSLDATTGDEVTVYGDANLWTLGFGASESATSVIGDSFSIIIVPDFDADGDVDGTDFLTFSNCFNGALKPPAAGCADPNADLDGDGDVDVFDFITFSNCFNGALNPPKCE